MKKRNLLLIGMISALLLTGCQNNTDNAENEALKQQIVQLEQQVTALEQQTAEDAANENAEEMAAATEETSADASGSEAASDQTSAPDSTASSQAASYTMEELTSMVAAFEEKAKAAAPTGDSSGDLEEFFSLKQEENQVDDALDRHEDELEAQYRNGTLTRNEYKSLERELEALEDQLDNAEDRLELTFGIND